MHALKVSFSKHFRLVRINLIRVPCYARRNEDYPQEITPYIVRQSTRQFFKSFFRNNSHEFKGQAQIHVSFMMFESFSLIRLKQNSSSIIAIFFLQLLV